MAMAWTYICKGKSMNKMKNIRNPNPDDGAAGDV